MASAKKESSKELLKEIAELRQQVSDLEKEKADLEILMKLTAEHSDSVADELYSAVEITQREGEERFKLITDTVPVPIVISRQEDDVIVYANAAAGELIGTDNLAGRSIKEFYSDTNREKILAAIQETDVVEIQEIEGKQENGENFWATLFIRPLTFNEEPCLLEAYHNFTAYKLAEMERAKLQEEIIAGQQRAIIDLSTPVIPILDGILIMPLVGSIDDARAKNITRSLLAGIGQYQAKIVIVDITGVPIIDTGVANYLTRTIQAARLKGAQTIVTGISEAVAETIVDLGIDWSHMTTLSDLQTGLLVALRVLGKKLT